MQASRLYLSIPCVCTACGHKGFDRLGEDTKCMFCGKELRFNIKDAQVDAILSSLDTSRIFGYTLKPTDITNDEAFTTIASKSVTAPTTYYKATRHGSKFVSLNEDEVMKNDKIRIAQNKVMSHQRQVNELCKEMLSIWEFISFTNVAAGSRMLKSFLTIDEDKTQLAKRALGAQAVAADPCINARKQTSQDALARPSLMLTTSQQDTPVQPVTQQNTTKERKLEYLYTLFDALFQCVEASFGLTREDLKDVMPEETTLRLTREDLVHTRPEKSAEITVDEE